MEFSSFSETIISVPFERAGEIVQLQVNIDAFTPEFFRHVGKMFDTKMRQWKTEEKKKTRKKADSIDFFEENARGLEVEREIYATLLTSGVLKGWDVTLNGESLEPSSEVLMKLPPLVVKGIWTAALDSATTVKKRAEEADEETLEAMPNGSKELAEHAPAM
jgi:hypothetical protein